MLTCTLCSASFSLPAIPTSLQPCPTNMVARSDRATYPNSASYYVTNGDTPLTGGFTDTRACVTQDGFGMSARGAQQCMQGFYNPKDTYSACAACDFGTTTAGVGRGFTQADCGIAKGFGLVDGKIQTCPIGGWAGCCGWSGLLWVVQAVAQLMKLTVAHPLSCRTRQHQYAPSGCDRPCRLSMP